jgi:hypothetical protein
MGGPSANNASPRPVNRLREAFRATNRHNAPKLIP